jgi:hypothetical protein
MGLVQVRLHSTRSETSLFLLLSPVNHMDDLELF